MKEANRERLANFLTGASIPGIIFVPAIGYVALHGDINAAIGLGELGIPVMTLWGLHGVQEFKGTYSARQRNKDLRRGSRRTVKEVVLGRLPSTPPDVKNLLRDIYEHTENDNLSKGEALVQSTSSIDKNANLAQVVLSRVMDVIMEKKDIYSMQEEEKQTYVTEVDTLIHLIQFGWQIGYWEKRGFKPVINEDDQYSERRVASIVTDRISEIYAINNRKQLTNMLEAISIPR